MTPTLAPATPLTAADKAAAQLQALERDYGDVYVRLAYHAAFPLSLNSDLLYRLWGALANDGSHSPIPYGAVAKLLLGTSLFTRTGEGLYEMKPEMRQHLLHRLEADPRFGATRLQALADHTLRYAEAHLHHADAAVRDFAKVQRWGAMAYRDTPQAARELAQALRYAYLEDRDDLGHMARVVLRLEDPLQGYPDLLTYARGMEKLAAGKEDEARALLEGLLSHRRPPSVDGVELPLPTWQADAEHPAPHSAPPPIRWVALLGGIVTVAATTGFFAWLMYSMWQTQMETAVAPSPEATPLPQLSESPLPLPADEAWEPPTPEVDPAPNPLLPSLLQAADTIALLPTTVPSPGDPSPVDPPDPVEPSPTPTPTGPVPGTPGGGDPPVAAPGSAPIPEPPSPLSIANSSLAEVLPPGVDPEPLQTALAVGDFRQADEQTYELLLAVGDVDGSGWLSLQEIESLSCEAIRAIDQEWLNHSNGNFGFSVQADIWREMGSPDPYGTDAATVEQLVEFGDRVGWGENGQWHWWLTDVGFFEDPSNPPRILPFVPRYRFMFGGGIELGSLWGVEFFPQLYVNCSR